MSLFTSRRKPKRIARDDPEAEDEAAEDTGPVVRRPTSNAPKNKSKLRVSFNPGDDAGSKEDSAEDGSAVVKPARKGPLSAAQSLLGRPREDPDIQAQTYERPSYSKAALDELRNSTPSTPRDLSTRASPSTDLIDPSSNIDLEAKFGPSAKSSIPSATEIREKKERRARLALEATATASSSSPHEQDFISLDDYNSDGEFKPRRMQLGTYYPPEKSTRLVRDDEDIAEGFDDFTEDAGRVALSKRSARKQAHTQRAAIRDLIDAAEATDSATGSSDDDSDGPSRRAAYDHAQTHRGMDGLAAHAAHTRRANRPRPPRDTAPVPKLAVGLARLRDMVSALEFERGRIEKRRADIARERDDIRASQAHIQRSLEEAGGELERVQREHEEAVRGKTAVNGAAEDVVMAVDGSGSGSGSGSGGGNENRNGLAAASTSQGVIERGLESIGGGGGGAASTTPLQPRL